MAKYARKKDGRLVDVWRVPEDFATLDDLNKCLPGGGFVEVPSGAQNGAADNGDGSYTNPEQASVSKPEFKTLSGSDFIALLSKVLGIARVDQLLAKSKTIETLLVKAVTVERLTGNTPTAIAFLKTGENALTTEELAQIDAAWKLLSSPAPEE